MRLTGLAAASALALLPLLWQQKLQLKVGQAVDLHLISNSTICDDLAIVSVEATDTAIRVTGLKEGATLCSFGVASGPRTVYEITVVPSDKDKKKDREKGDKR